MITEPLQHVFIQKALYVSILAGINCAWVGTYLVLRRMAFMGEALAHTILPGVVFAYLRGFQMFIGALGASLITALGISWLTSNRNLREDTAIGVLLSCMFAIGVAMMSAIRSFRDFGSLLFGSILSISTGDVWLIMCTSALVMGMLSCLHKELELSSLDPEYAQVIGIRPRRLHTLLLMLVALSVVSAVKVMGALLTTALLITPAATACLIGKTLRQVLGIASAVAAFSSILGIYLSYYYPIASGASIVLCASGIFLATWLYKRLIHRSLIFQKSKS